MEAVVHQHALSELDFLLQRKRSQMYAMTWSDLNANTSHAAVLRTDFSRLG